MKALNTTDPCIAEKRCDARLKAILASHERDFEAVSDKIWDFAEFRFQEKRSTELQAKFLE